MRFIQAILSAICLTPPAIVFVVKTILFIIPELNKQHFFQSF